jgi:hypothetical protein
VGRQLGWQEQCQRMRQLLQARCGRFGDEPHFCPPPALLPTRRP